MALTIAQTQAAWRQQHRMRISSFNKWAREWAAYYLSEGMKFIESQDEDSIFLEEDVRDLFIRMYVDVGGVFGALGFMSVKNKPIDMLTKDDGLEPAMIANWEAQMQHYALQFGSLSITSIAATGRGDAITLMQQLIAQAIEEGLGADDTAALIEREFASRWRVTSRFNAERIARTEIIAASNYGAFIGAESTGLLLQKTWLTNLDGRERDTHAMANGQVVPMDGKFQVGASKMSFPGDKSAPPEEVINCRCAVSYTSPIFDNV